MNIYAIDNYGRIIKGYTEEGKDRLRLVIPASSVPKNIEELYVTSDEFKYCVGDEGYYLCGCDFKNYSSFLTYFTERDDFKFERGRTLIGAFGVKNSKRTYLGFFTGMKYNFNWRIEKKGNEYTLGFFYDITKVDIYEDIVIEIIKCDKKATYMDLAKKYRKYMLTEGGCVPLKKRMKTRKALEYVKDAVEIRIRMAWKPAPPTVLEQTIENEPDIHVACTFEDVMNLVRAMRREGIRKAQICLVGWNKSGHDGRWPDAFPVEPLLGGEEKLRELIELAKNAGYKIVCHTNSTDCYNISERFNGGEIVNKDKQGEWERDIYAWSGGVMWHLCPIRAWEYAQEILPKIADLGFEGTHYIDVMSIVPVRNCFDSNHPCNANQTMDYFTKIADLTKDLFGGYASEGGWDHSAHYVDYSLYNKFDREEEPGMDEGIPFWEFVFHGIILANTGTTTVNYPIKTPLARLQLAEFNGRPSFYAYSCFMNNGYHWMGDKDLQIHDEEKIKKAVAAIKVAHDEYINTSYLQTETVEDYRHLADDVFEVTYSDGSKIIANYSDKEFEKDGNVVPAVDYLVLKPEA